MATEDVKGSTTSKSAKNRETLGTDALNSDLKMMRNMSAGLTRDNWATALENVHFNTKSVNAKSWTSKQDRKTNLRENLTGAKSIGDIHDKLKDCLFQLRAQTPENIAQFNYNEWLSAYKCPIYTYIELVRLIADMIPAGTNIMQANTVMRLLCALHEVLRTLFLYPFIDIRILSNTLKNRMEQYKDKHVFHRFYHDHPGLEHKAGVAQGQTFVLLFQANFSENRLGGLSEYIQGYIEDHADFPIDIEQVFSFIESEQLKIVGDFTLPYKCCDPCSDIKQEPAQLDPIALPICEVVPIREIVDPTGQSNLEYLVLNEKMLHTMYEPERYRVELTSQAEFGFTEIYTYPFEFDPNKSAQAFRYTVDIKRVLPAFANSDKAYIEDIIDYAIHHNETGELLDSSSISVFIPNIFNVEIQEIGVTGFIRTNINGVLRPVQGADVRIFNDSVQPVIDITNDAGQYRLTRPDLQPGEYMISVFKTGFHSLSTEITIDNGMLDLDMTIQPFLIIINDGNNLFSHLGIDASSADAVMINESFRKNSRLYNKAIEDAIKAERDNSKTLKETKDAISRFAGDEELITKELNATFKKHRDTLLKEIEAAPNKLSKTNRTNALKVLTQSYMDRLVLKEPGKLTVGSAKTIKETALAFNKSEANLKGSFNAWAKGKEDLIGKEAVKDIKSKFKLR